MARTIGHVYFQGHTRGEVMSAVPDMSGFKFRFAVFLKKTLEFYYTEDLLCPSVDFPLFVIEPLIWNQNYLFP